MENKNKKAVLAGGCFWGLEDLIKTIPGVIDTEVGFTGGTREYPNWFNHAGHAEAVQIEFDPTVTTYKKILDFFFQVHNPTTLNQQGNDKGKAYRSAIFYANEEEKRIAEEMITIVDESGRWADPVVTTLEPFVKFWPEDECHQDYLEKHPGGYTCHAIYFDSYLN